MFRLCRRVDALERLTGDCAFALIDCEADDTSDDAVARWEAANGPLGSRQPILVNCVDAAL